MSESQAQNIRANNADVPPPGPTADNGPGGTKPVDIKAPYEHALPKDGDPWTTLLTPELEADTLRCNAWKDEVQNLLIFAGLFSAVVTTFVVESYKLLLPDPNDAITGLLFHIASGLNNTSPFPPAVSPDSILAPFSQTSSAIRINVFWFISLILSLTTVLVGTIALQWLREHQSYGGYSSKEKLAMLHMRSEAIEAWYLRQVFAVLPLLLQAALVLFLAGLIDFSLPLGTKLVIPVSIIVGLTLLFLAATTILPSLQGLFFFCGLYPRTTLPTPCPFKSPQSLAFRSLFRICIHAIFRIFPSPFLDFDSSSPDSDGWCWKIENRSLLIADHLVPSVRKMWYQRTWPTLDREWLSLRDALHQCILDHDPELYHHRTSWEDSFPLSDAIQYLVKVAQQTPGFKHTDSFLAALVLCFNELAESTWTGIVWEEFKRQDRRSNYFEHLHSKIAKSCSLSNFILHGGIYKSDQPSGHDFSVYHINPEAKSQFSTDQTMIFLCMLLDNHPSPALHQYYRELWLQVLHLIGNIEPLIPAIPDGSSPIPIPTILTEFVVNSMICTNLLTPDQQYSTATNVLTAIIELAASHHVSHNRTTEFLLTHPGMPGVLLILAFWTSDHLASPQKDPFTKQDILLNIDDQLAQLFKFISDYLNEALSNTSSSSKVALLDVFFYLTSIFSWHLLDRLAFSGVSRNQDSHFWRAFRSSLNALHKTWISGQKNDLLEIRFKGHEWAQGIGREMERFSDQWWNEIFGYLTGPGPCILQRGPISSSEGSPPDPSLQHQYYLNLETNVRNVINLLAATSPGNVCQSAEPTTDSVAPLTSACPKPYLENSGHEPAFISANDEDESISQSQSDLPTILHHPEASTEGAGTTDDHPLSRLRPSSDGPDETPPSGNDGVATAAATARLISQPGPLPSAADSDDVVPRQAAMNGTSASDGNERQPGGRHLVIEVEPTASSEEIGVEIPGSGDDHPQDEAQPEDAVVRMKSPN